MNEPMDPQGVNAVEVERWNSAFGEKWVSFQQGLDTCFSPVSDRLIERAKVKSGDRVLDVGCGAAATVVEVAARVGPSGRVLGVDISQPLLGFAKNRTADLKHVDYVLADAQTHSFPAGGFDLLISRFGVMFFEDPVAAFSNMALALRPRGRMAFAAWAPVEHNPWFTIPRDAAVVRLGAPVPADPRAPGPLAFADTEYVEDILHQAGLTEVWSATESLRLTNPASLEEVVKLASSIGPAARIHKEKAGTEEDLAAIEREVSEKFRKYMFDSGFSIPAAINFYEAVRG